METVLSRPDDMVSSLGTVRAGGLRVLVDLLARESGTTTSGLDRLVTLSDALSALAGA